MDQVALATSNFSRWGRAHWPGAVSIARRSPSWYTGLRYLPLAPSEALLAYALKGLPWEVYQRWYWAEKADRYGRHREDLDPRQVLADILALVPPGAEVVLLCHEGRDDVLHGRKHCHRELLWPWFNAAGIECGEVAK